MVELVVGIDLEGLGLLYPPPDFAGGLLALDFEGGFGCRGFGESAQ